MKNIIEILSGEFKAITLTVIRNGVVLNDAVSINKSYMKTGERTRGKYYIFRMRNRCIFFNIKEEMVDLVLEEKCFNGYGTAYFHVKVNTYKKDGSVFIEMTENEEFAASYQQGSVTFKIEIK